MLGVSVKYLVIIVSLVAVLFTFGWILNERLGTLREQRVEYCAQFEPPYVAYDASELCKKAGCRVDGRGEWSCRPR